jgi:hypothetical protein
MSSSKGWLESPIDKRDVRLESLTYERPSVAEVGQAFQPDNFERIKPILDQCYLDMAW